MKFVEVGDLSVRYLIFKKMLLPWFLVLGGVWGVGKLEPRFLLASPDGCECFLVFV